MTLGATNLFIATQLRIAHQSLCDAVLLQSTGSRNASNLLFQAVEAALIAVMTSENLATGRQNQHQLDKMTSVLPDLNPMKTLFRPLQKLTGYATTFRYALPSGGLKTGLSDQDFADLSEKIQKIIQDLSAWYVVDLDQAAKTPAKNLSPMRVVSPKPVETVAPKPKGPGEA